MVNYESPTIEVLGSVAELTEMPFNKVGTDADAFTPQVPLVGSVIPAPST